MNSEYKSAEHIARELLGMLLEDGCDAVAVTWSRTTGKRTDVRHESIGNNYAVLGMLNEVIDRYEIEENEIEEGKESFDD